jgi:hypothetical protein
MYGASGSTCATTELSIARWRRIGMVVEITV